MLRSRSIRTKLIVALTLLSMVVLLLFVSAFYGLRGYHQSTNAVILRASELSYAQKLNEQANSLRAANQRILSRRDSDQMIDSAFVLDARLEAEVLNFGIEIDAFQLALDRYPVANPEPDSQLQSSLPRAEESAGLAIVRGALEKFESDLNQPPTLYWEARRSIASSLDNLVVATSDNVELVDADLKKLTHDLRAHYRTWTTIAGISVSLVVLIVAAGSWSMHSLVVKPFRTLLDGSRLVAGGQFDHRIDLGTDDELSELAIAMNDMTDRFQGALNTVNSWCTDLDQQVRDRTKEVIQNEQFASVGFLAAGVAHEINNPLATIAWSAESLQSRFRDLRMLPEEDRMLDDEFSQTLTDNLRRIEEEAFRCKGITEKLLDFSRLSEVRRAPTNLYELASDVVELVGKVGEYRCKSIHIEGDEEVTAHVNPQEIRQVLLNLLTNALESVDTDGRVEVKIASDSLTASISVQDNGCGMSPEVLQHLFEPFFTRRRDGTGTGLGLSITYRIVSQHGGSLIAHSEGEGHGSTLELLLPVNPESESIGMTPNAIGWNHEPIKIS